MEYPGRIIFLFRKSLVALMIFCVRQIIVEKYRESKRKLFMIFIYLVKAYDRVHREILKWVLKWRNLGV